MPSSIARYRHILRLRQLARKFETAAPASSGSGHTSATGGAGGNASQERRGSRAAIALPVDEDAAIRFQDQLVTLDLQYERKSV
jgi:hypothetical protein